MVKAKLINDEKYYRLRRKQQMLLFLPTTFIAMIYLNIENIPLWLSVIFLTYLVFVIVLSFRNQKHIRTIFGKDKIELDTEQIKVKADKTKIFDLTTVDKIVVKNDYCLEDGGIKSLIDKHKNFVGIRQGKELKIFHFEIDSHYTVKQIGKLIKAWQDKGYALEFVS